MVTKKKVEEAEPKKAIASFTKAQIYNSKRFREEKDLIMAILENDKSYTIEEVDCLIKEYKGKAV